MGNKLGVFSKHRIFLGSLDESSPEGKFTQVVSSILTYKAFETLLQVQEKYIYPHTSTPFRPPPPRSTWRLVSVAFGAFVHLGGEALQRTLPQISTVHEH